MNDRRSTINDRLPASHAILSSAAEGRLPAWAEVRPKRYGHIARVAELMGEWALRLGEPPEEQARWRATGLLHDALRDAEPETLRAGLDSPFREMPGYYLHGPAVAARLEADGVTDTELREAIRYHTLGCGRLGRLGRALIAADWLEPGRAQLPVQRSALRARMPESLDRVFATIVAMRVRKSLERGKPIRRELAEMWNSVAEGRQRQAPLSQPPPAGRRASAADSRASTAEGERSTSSAQPSVGGRSFFGDGRAR